MSLLSKYFMPAEWAPHDACLTQYPHNPYTFRFPQAHDQFLQMVKAIAVQGKEPVVVFCPTQEEAQLLQKKIDQDLLVGHDDASIVTRVCPSDDTWSRDMAPTFVLARAAIDDKTSDQSPQQDQRVGIDWDFNAWGQKYPDFEQDKLVAQTMCEQLNSIGHITGCRKVPIVLEGGSIHVDGEGTLLTTEQCLLNPNRNPTKTREELEAILGETLDVQKIIWLPHGVDADEDTDGHVDNFCCFSEPGHVILSWTDDEEHDSVNYARCRVAKDILDKSTDAKGRSLTVHKLYLPPPIFYTKEDMVGLMHEGTMPTRTVGERMAGSYVNFYIANQAVIVPQLGIPESDRKAVETLQELFPNRQVVGVPSKEILIGGGNIHCQLQQFPSVPQAP